jgi:hypothetical protein
MRQRNIVVAGAIALCMTVAAGATFACDNEKASASAAGHGCSMTQTASMHGACGTKSSMASIFKEAPGTKTEFKRMNNGVALVVTASDARYVPVVQNALLQHVNEMQTLAGEKVSGSCSVGASASSAHCAGAKASAQKVGSSGSCPFSKTEQASVQKTSGSSCCAGKSAAAKTSMQATNGMSECPDWMKVLCSADMKVEKTSKGVMITWTSPRKDKVNELQAAGEKFHADLAQL